MPYLKQVTAPQNALLSLTEVKAHCRIDGSDHDDVLATLILAVTSYLDGYDGSLGRALITQEWSLQFQGVYSRVQLGLGPFQQITSITYIDKEGVAQTVDSSIYRVDDADLTPYLELCSGTMWPSTHEDDDTFTVTWQCGYGLTSDDVPAAIKQAALLLIGHWFEHREAVIIGQNTNALPMGVDALLAPFRQAL